MSNITNETSKILGIAKLRGIPRLQRSLFPSDYEKLKRQILSDLRKLFSETLSDDALDHAVEQAAKAILPE